MKARRRFFLGGKKAVANGRLNLVASQFAMDGGDPLKTGMNKGEPGNHWFPGAFLVTFGAIKK
jgi:hypothetical protein